jgi:phosphatidylglycerol lysyltransferase
MLIANTFGAYRWSVLISEANAPKSGLFFNAFGFYSLGQITGLVVPSRIGNYAKVPLVMKLDNIPYESGLSAVNAETLLDLAYISLAGIASLSILSVYLYSSFEFVSIILLFLLIAILIGILVILYKLDHFEEIYEKSRSHAGETGRHLLTRIPSRFFSKIFELTQSTKNIFTNRYCLLKTGSSTVIFQFIGIFSFFLVIESAHVTLSFPVTFAILTLSILAGIISLIPGGLGASDLSLVVLLVSQGITLPVATNIVILWRIVMYLPILLVIGIYLLKRNERPKDSASQ